jgi:cysteine-rich repeat protein
MRFTSLLALVSLGAACGPGASSDDGPAPAVCGDGKLDPDELCDDGNLIAGDGCSPECMPSGMPYDCVDLYESEHDIVRGLALFADGTFVVGGYRGASPEPRGWLGRFDGSGAQRWFVDTTTLDPQFRTVHALAGDDAGIWALVFLGDSVRAPHIVRFNLDGELTDSVAIESEFGLRLFARDLEVTAAGVWIVGEAREGGSQADAWLGLYDPALGTVEDVLRVDELGYDDIFSAVHRDGEGVAVVGTMSTTPNHDQGELLTAKTDILVVWVDANGDELRRTKVGPSPDPAWIRTAGRIGSDSEGRWFVGGALSSVNLLVPNQSWTAQVDGAWSLVSEFSWTSMMGREDSLIASGIVRDYDESTHYGWLGEFDSNGAPRWEFGGADGVPGYNRHTVRRLAIDTAGVIRTAGELGIPEEPRTVRSCLVAR